MQITTPDEKVANPQPPPLTPKKPAKLNLSPEKVQILVFNVCHLDVIFGIKKVATEEEMAKSKQLLGNAEEDGHYELVVDRPDRNFSRPRFNRYYPMTVGVRDSILSNLDSLLPLKCPFDAGSHEEADDFSHKVAEAPTIKNNSNLVVPVGYSFEQSPVLEESLKSFHIRATDDCSQPPSNEPVEIVSVMFPLLAQVLATWLDMIELADMDSAQHTMPSKKVVFLVSGAGKPRNRDLDIRSNSTKCAAEMMRIFIEREFPRVETKILDSGLGVFHYDQNVTFCNEVLLPAVEQLRHPLVLTYGDEWKKRLHMTIALTDGSPARLAALNASLRTYKPNYLHMWQLKTFWYEHKFFQDDLLFQSFESMETKPPLPYEELDERSRVLLDEMRKYKVQFENAKQARSLDELSAFWLRKTRKVVLSVLMVKSATDDMPRFYRGMNLEVSMPTGSLCSERNVIGTALASDPTLRRQDLLMISVLSMTLDPPVHFATLPDTPMVSPRKLVRANGFTVEANSGRLLKLRPRSQSSTASVNSGGNKYIGELNPIQPCGACNEWLKKIAEVNPTFKVMTFPNSDCEEAFIQEIN